MKQITFILLVISLPLFCFSQTESVDTTNTYKKRVLETTEVEFLSSYYAQSGDNAAVSGGTGTEELTDFHPTVVIAIPLNADDVISVSYGISAYTSASSSNVDPFDGNGPADPFQASSGASSGDIWYSFNGSYSHSSDDRNTVWTANASYSGEYDYSSVGVGGSLTKLFNEKNTEFSIKLNAFVDNWNDLYPRELRSFDGGSGLNSSFFNNKTITGNTEYNPANYQEFNQVNRNSYSVGLGFAQILSRNMQGSFSLDLVQQTGLLSTPFQRVYFSDVDDSFIEDFHLADDIERLPDSRFKIALGGRLHYYLNERMLLRTFYRFYSDDWAIRSHTAKIELPVKITDQFTITPSYRFYMQTASDYFAPYNQHLSSSEFYTSDYDLSNFNANQYGLDISYTDVFTKAKVWKFGLKSIDLSLNYYDRNTSFSSYIVGMGLKFVIDK